MILVPWITHHIGEAIILLVLHGLTHHGPLLELINFKFILHQGPLNDFFLELMLFVNRSLSPLAVVSGSLLLVVFYEK